MKVFCVSGKSFSCNDTEHFLTKYSSVKQYLKLARGIIDKFNISKLQSLVNCIFLFINVNK